MGDQRADVSDSESAVDELEPVEALGCGLLRRDFHRPKPERSAKVGRSDTTVSEIRSKRQS
jgi:hypothetical protein